MSSYTFGELYGIGDIAFKNLTGHCLNPYALSKLKTKDPGFMYYKNSRRRFDTFAYCTSNDCALWLNRGDYNPAIILKN